MWIKEGEGSVKFSCPDQAAQCKIAFCYESLEKVFKELSYEMGLLAKVDSQMHGEYTKMLNGFCI